MKKIFTILLTIGLITLFTASVFAEGKGLQKTNSVIKVQGVDKYSNVYLPAPLDGTYKAGTFKGTKDGQTVNFYCIDLFHPLAIGEDYQDTGTTPSKITYILNNYYPYAGLSSQSLTTNKEAAAVQVAIWYFSDSLNVSGVTPTEIRDRALEIIADANTNAHDVFPIKTLIINMPDQSFEIGQPIKFTVEAYDDFNRPIEGREIVLSSSDGVLSTVTVHTNSSGVSDTITILPSGGGFSASVSASATGVGIPQGTTFYHVANPDGKQKLVLATPFMDEKDVSAEANWFGQPNLTISKTNATSTVGDGEILTYVITITNNGTAAATNVQVSDVLPGILQFQSAVENSGASNTYDPATGIWEAGTIPASGSKTLTIKAKVNYAGQGSTGSVYDLGPAKDYNLFVLNSMTSFGGDTEGKVAVGKNAVLSNYSVADKLPANSGDVLIVGGKLNYISGRVCNGNIVYGKFIDTTHANLADNTIRKEKNLIDFKAAKVYLKNLSKQLYALTPNGTVDYDGYGKLTLTGTDPNLNIFEVSGSQLQSTNAFFINIPAGASAVVNYTGKYFEFSGDFIINGVRGFGDTSPEIEAVASKVILNLFKAKKVSVQNIGLLGTLLAPKATLNFVSGVIYGQVIVNKMQATTNNQFNWVQYGGTIQLDTTINNVAEIIQYGEENSTMIDNVFQEDGKNEVGSVFAVNYVDFDKTKTVGVEETNGLPQEFELNQNYPNPFNPSTTIEYSIPTQGFYTLKVYNIIGKEIATLVNDNLSAGKYSVKFQASHLASGIYFYRLIGNNVNITRKMMLLK